MRDAPDFTEGSVVDAVAADLKAQATARLNAGRVARFRQRQLERGGDDPATGPGSLPAKEHATRVRLLAGARAGDAAAIAQLRERYQLILEPGAASAPPRSRRRSAPPA